MKCVMCPRTTTMQRKNIWINDDLFEEMLNQTKVYKDDELNKFWEWLEKDAKFDHKETSENGFIFQLYQDV